MTVKPCPVIFLVSYNKNLLNQLPLPLIFPTETNHVTHRHNTIPNHLIRGQYLLVARAEHLTQLQNNLQE